jgi:hypothetical protein
LDNSSNPALIPTFLPKKAMSTKKGMMGMGKKQIMRKGTPQRKISMMRLREPTSKPTGKAMNSYTNETQSSTIPVPMLLPSLQSVTLQTPGPAMVEIVLTEKPSTFEPTPGTSSVTTTPTTIKPTLYVGNKPKYEPTPSPVPLRGSKMITSGKGSMRGADNPTKMNGKSWRYTFSWL